MHESKTYVKFTQAGAELFARFAANRSISLRVDFDGIVNRLIIDRPPP
jgi:hypothetical protein